MKIVPESQVALKIVPESQVAAIVWYRRLSALILEIEKHVEVNVGIDLLLVSSLHLLPVYLPSPHPPTHCDTHARTHARTHIHTQTHTLTLGTKFVSSKPCYDPKQQKVIARTINIKVRTRT